MATSFDKISIQKCILFHHLIKEGSPAAVSRKLKIPAFKVHNDLNAVEKFIGEPLIIRNQNRLALTEIGHSFAEFCRIVVENLSLIQLDTPIPDELTLAVTHGISEVELPDILIDFYKEFPNIKINLFTGPEYLDFTDSRVDVLIGPSLTNRSDLTQTHLSTDLTYLYASCDYLDKFGMPKNIYDLRNHRLLIYRGVKLYPRDVFDSIEPFFTSNNLKSIYEMTVRGLGIAPLPKNRLQLDANLNRNLINVIENLDCCEIKISFIYKRFSSKSVLIGRLCEIAKSYFERIEQ